MNTYGKLIDGRIEFAPNAVELEDGSWVCPPTKKMLTDAGYKPLEYNDPPEPKENYTFIPSWNELKTKIKQVWTEQYVEPEYTLEERVKIAEDALMEIAEMLSALTEGE